MEQKASTLGLFLFLWRVIGLTQDILLLFTVLWNLETRKWEIVHLLKLVLIVIISYQTQNDYSFCFSNFSVSILENSTVI